MYEQFFGFREKPFTLVPDPTFLFLSRQHRLALAMLEYGVLNRAGMTVITGEIGSGKTTLIRHLLNQLGDDVTVGLISNTHKAFGNLLQWVCLAYGLLFEGKQEVTLYNNFVQFLIGEYAKGKRTILIVDEAQNMDADTLEELRVLSNINADKDQVIQMILAGQPELRAALKSPALHQLVQRVGVAYHLDPLDLKETREYIYHRLKVAGGKQSPFATDAFVAIHRHSGGIPRLINKLCDTTLVYAYAEQISTVPGRLVDEVVKEQNDAGIFLHSIASESDTDTEPPRKNSAV